MLVAVVAAVHIVAVVMMPAVVAAVVATQVFLMEPRLW
jgi:hypothetical protein